MKRLTGLALTTLLVASACSSPRGGAPSSAPTDVPTNAAVTAVGSAAPAFAATSLDGKPVASSDFAGKVLVLNFWATWCPPCRAETPDMIRAYGKLNAKDVAFLGVDTTETAPVVKSFVALKGLPYQVALGNADVYNAYGIAYIPTTIVIDAHGIVRARWTGGVTPEQLADYVASARSGKNSLYLTPEQKKIDALLATAQFNFTGSPAAVTKEIARANKRLDDVGTYLDKLNEAPTLRYDSERTTRDSGELELAAANALASIAKSPKDHVAADMQLGAADADLNRFADAATTYKAALAIEPKNTKIHDALANAYYRLHDYTAMADEATTWTQLAPHDSDAWDALGLAHQRARQFSEAVPAYEKALKLLTDEADKQPIGKNGKADAYAADEALDVANVYVSLGDAANAKRVFGISQHYADRIPADGKYKALKARVPDRIVEGMAGVAMAHGAGTTISLAKWTGADLPGSLATAYRWRLVAVAPGGESVTLSTKGLKDGWIASFCQDRLCSPNQVTFTMPAEGIKTYEFQLVAPSPTAKTGPISVGASDSNWVTTPAV